MNKKILDRLAKLLKHERSARDIGSVAEAEAFAQRIGTLCTEYGLSLSEIDIAGEESTLGTERTEIRIRDNWRAILLNAIGIANGVFVLRQDSRAILTGSETDRAITAEVYSYFAELGLSLVAGEMAKRRGTRDTRSFRNGYLLGYAAALSSRIQAAHADAMTAARADAAVSSTALVYVGNKLEKAQAEAMTLFDKVKTARPAKFSNRDGYETGQTAGNQVALTTKTLSNTKRIGA